MRILRRRCWIKLGFLSYCWIAICQISAWVTYLQTLKLKCRKKMSNELCLLLIQLKRGYQSLSHMYIRVMDVTV